MRKNMKVSVFVLSCFFAGLVAHEASAAIKFKRFPTCPEGVVNKKTCECHAGASGRYHICHTGQYCNTMHGMCW